jgi:MerR family copper efflux transcriptional regulator
LRWTKTNPVSARPHAQPAACPGKDTASAAGDRDLMTIGELASRTGMSRKSIRELDGLGLIYTAGRSEANYRLFDESALWCVRVIRELRSLGLTLKEIQQLASVYLDQPREPIGPRLAALLDRAQRRIEERVAELETIGRRIVDYRRENAAVLAGARDADLTVADPRRRRTCP